MVGSPLWDCVSPSCVTYHEESTFYYFVEMQSKPRVLHLLGSRVTMGTKPSSYMLFIHSIFFKNYCFSLGNQDTIKIYNFGSYIILIKLIFTFSQKA